LENHGGHVLGRGLAVGARDHDDAAGQTAKGALQETGVGALHDQAGEGGAAAAAAALALAAGLSLDDVAEGLKGFSNIKGRLNVKSGIKGATLIDDTYNANPDSMKAAIDVLARMSAPRIFVMGDMGELGEDEAAAMHAEVGTYARDKGIEAAYFVGDNSVEAAETFGAEGLWFADKDPLIQVLSHDLPERATVLVKGSRFMKMEEVVEALTDKEVV